MNLLVGIVLVVVLRFAFVRLLLVKPQRDVAALKAGDRRPLLSGYAKDAVPVFNDTVRMAAFDADLASRGL